MFETDFMSYRELIERLRVDLDSPSFFGFDLQVPNNEEEYQTQLRQLRTVLDRSGRRRNEK